MKPAVQFNHVSKRFALHRQRSRSLQEIAINLFRRGRPNAGGAEEFWALRDVSFEIAPGETVGLIGVNGAGKSTALKLMARILNPTSGQILVNGRVGALLELGTGFHPDLTGRENVYLNGAIMGLSRQEIGRKMDEIIAFSELDRFIDVPVKHYSSGMYVRLGFATAIHTRPDLLIVDEVLAVGDASFQRKCLDYISELQRAGATVVLVSHDLSSIQLFCHQAIWFEQGKLRAQGKALDVIMAYVESVARKGIDSGETDPQAEELARRRWGTGRIRVTRVELCNAAGRATTVFETGQPLEIRLHYEAAEPIQEPVFGLGIHHQNGTHICGPNTQISELTIPEVRGRGVISYHIPHLDLLEGTYLISIAAVNKTQSETYDYHDRLYPLHVYRGQCREIYGLFNFNGSWTLSSETSS